MNSPLPILAKHATWLTAVAVLTACTGSSLSLREIPDEDGRIASNVRVSIAAVGDIMLGTDFPDNRLPADDAESLLLEVGPVLRSADIAFGNLEGVLLDGGEAEKQCQDPLKCYVFRTPERYVDFLVEAGFDVMSLANNHARDFGEAGRTRTEQVLDAAGIRHSGRHGDIARWTVKGRRVAMIAFAPFRGAHNMLDTQLAYRQVKALARRHDIVIVSMHGGAEGEEAMRVPFDIEYFHRENRGDVVTFSRTVIDAGADLVLGHGPHVPRAMEVYRDRLVAYSLGNFCTFYGINVRGPNGLAPILEVQLDADGRFIDGRIHSARQERPRGPVFDETNEAANLIGTLTQSDFPDGVLRVDGEGRLFRQPAVPLANAKSRVVASEDAAN